MAFGGTLMTLKFWPFTFVKLVPLVGVSQPASAVPPMPTDSAATATAPSMIFFNSTSSRSS